MSRRVSMPSIATIPWRTRKSGSDSSARQLDGVGTSRGPRSPSRRAARLHVRAVHAVVADVRHGHRDDLAGVARVGEDLLVADERRVEARLAVSLAGRAAGDAREDRAVLECEQRGRSHLRDHLPVAQSELAGDHDLGRLAEQCSPEETPSWPTCSGRTPWSTSTVHSGSITVRSATLPSASRVTEARPSTRRGPGPSARPVGPSRAVPCRRGA